MAMRLISIVLLATLLASCATHKSGISKRDPFDDVKVDQMVGNNVSDAILQKTVVCLNARRESKRIVAVTNISVTLEPDGTVKTVPASSAPSAK